MDQAASRGRTGRHDETQPRPARAPQPPSAVSTRMSRQRTRDTGPEMAVRRRLFALGKRFRVAYPVPGRPRCSIDVAFPGPKVAVFIDGCFWNGCPEHGSVPRTNTSFWDDKLGRNRRRDADGRSRYEAITAGENVVTDRVAKPRRDARSVRGASQGGAPARSKPDVTRHPTRRTCRMQRLRRSRRLRARTGS